MLRDFLIFLAGAAFMHTISHFILPYYVSMPFNVGFMTLTSSMNYWIVGISAVVTVALLLIAKGLKR